MTAKRKMTPTLISYQSALKRCYKTYSAKYPIYGGRGITMCDRWRESFSNFLEDMGERPEGKTLDRIDNDGNYEPSNCRWADRFEQAFNKSNTIKVAHEGNAYSLKGFSKVMGVPYIPLYKRVAKGQDVFEAVEKLRTPKPAVFFMGEKMSARKYAARVGVDYKILNWWMNRHKVPAMEAFEMIKNKRCR